MDLSDISAGTPKVLGRCLQLFDLDQDKHTGNHQVLLSAPVTPATFESNPDIQFFRLVKSKHHYKYHKTKESRQGSSSQRVFAKPNVFNPYSRQLLLSRLATFTALNWQIPFSAENIELNELLCASHGWTCESISQNNNTKNHLRCSGCGAQVVLQFNVEDAPQYTPFWFDADDIRLVNENLKKEYVTRVCSLAHLDHCSWRKLHTPIDSVYYLTPHVGFADDTLISEYLRTLYDLIKALPHLRKYSAELQKLLPPLSPDDLTPLMQVSNSYLLRRYYTDDKENWAAKLGGTCPDWVYRLAALGWDFKAQEFASERILLLVCTTCNNRVVIRAGGEESDVDYLSSSRLLSPCEFPAHVPAESESAVHDFNDMSNCEETGDIYYGHKTWCLHVKNIDNLPFHRYFSRMVIELQVFGEPAENFKDKDMKIDLEASGRTKRQNSFNVNERLETFSKLRKLYFKD